MTPRLRRALGTAALVTFGLCVGLALAELAARLAWRNAAVPARPTTPPPGLPVLRTVADLGRPNVRGVLPNGAYYRTNSLGVRGPEYGLAVPTGVFRIVVVGDSVTAGAGVEEDDAYPARLEAALAARGSARRHEVVNLGMPGLNLAQLVRRLEHVGLRYDPHLIVYGWTVNDIVGPGYVALAPPGGYTRGMASDHFAASPSYLLRVVWPHWVSFVDLVAPSPRSYRTELRHNYLENPAAWERFGAELDRLAALGADRGTCVVVFLHTALARLNVFHGIHDIYARVATAAGARGLHPVPSFHVFRGRDERTLHVAPRDAHPNREGHALLARALLQGLDGLPAGCWHPGGGDAP